METIHMKFIDDMTVAEIIYLKEKLVDNPNPNPMKELGMFYQMMIADFRPCWMN